MGDAIVLETGVSESEAKPLGLHLGLGYLLLGFRLLLADHLLRLGSPYGDRLLIYVFKL